MNKLTGFLSALFFVLAISLLGVVLFAPEVLTQGLPNEQDKHQSTEIVVEPTYITNEQQSQNLTPQVEETTKSEFEERFGFVLNRHSKKINDDYLGSILIPAIDVNDAVFGGEGEYYLHHDYRKIKNEVGEIYLDDRSSTNLTDNGALLNGHAVPNGSKFGNFKKLLNEDNPPDVYIWDEKRKVTVHYEMLFVSLIDGKTSGVIMEFESEEEQLRYYQRLHDTAIKRWTRPTSTDNYLIMNSCSYIIEKGHYVAFAREVGTYE